MNKITPRDPLWEEVKESLSNYRNNINIDLVRKYLGDFSDPVKVRKVSNYLTGSTFFMSRFNQMEICELMKDMRMRLKQV
ncbi:MAG TPA: hypothetical protein VK213_14315 [Bacteroidales bacterium]|nr:hypothetical protein [Bacteroidales bacterium]